MAIELRDNYTDDQNGLKKRSLFCDAADRIVEIYGGYGLHISGYHSSGLSIFSALPENTQKEILDRLYLFLDSLEKTESLGERVDNSDKSAWHALVSMGLTPPSELFKHIKSNSLVEIYDFEGHQIWRNFQFMKYCSYTLEEVYSLEWFKRYKRDDKINELCFKEVSKLQSGDLNCELVCPEIPRHVLEETISKMGLVFDVHYDIFCVLKDKRGERKAWMVVTSAEIIGKREISAPAQRTQERRLRLTE